MIEFSSSGVGILCPSCNRGIITHGDTSAQLYDYSNGDARFGMSIHMECPYCGDHVLSMDDGRTLTYNYFSGNFRRLKHSPIIAVDI